MNWTYRAIVGAMVLAPMAVATRAADMPTTGTLSVSFAGLRSAKGVIRACLTRNAKLYLHCERDKEALNASVVAGPGAHMDFADVPPGDYVLAVIHDENSNARVDTMLGIPREGVGFSRNPAMLFGPPKFEAARFHVSTGANKTDVKIKYFL